MAKINEFDEKEFNSMGLPDGDTFVNLKTADFKPTEQEFNGEKIKKYIMTIEKGEYYVPKCVMADIKKLSAKVNKVRITRTGTGKETRYTVVAVIE